MAGIQQDLKLSVTAWEGGASTLWKLLFGALCHAGLTSTLVGVWGHRDTLVSVLWNLITMFEANEEGRSQGRDMSSLLVPGRQTPGAFVPGKDTWG